MSEEIRQHLSAGDTWRRGMFILLFAVLYGVAELVLWFVVLFQFGSQLFSGHTNARLLEFSRGLNAYIYQILQFVTYRSDAMPYPFTPWPAEGPCDRQEEAVAATESEEEELAQTKRPPAEEIPSAQPPREDEGETESGV